MSSLFGSEFHRTTTRSSYFSRRRGLQLALSASEWPFFLVIATTKQICFVGLRMVAPYYYERNIKKHTTICVSNTHVNDTTFEFKASKESFYSKIRIRMDSNTTLKKATAGQEKMAVIGGDSDMNRGNFGNLFPGTPAQFMYVNPSWRLG